MSSTRYTEKELKFVEVTVIYADEHTDEMKERVYYQLQKDGMVLLQVDSLNDLIKRGCE